MNVSRFAAFGAVPALMVIGTIAGCASRAFVRPTGPATPLPDVAAVWADATRECRAIRGFRAEVGISGRVGSERIRGATLALAVDDAGHVGLEASAFGSSIFRLGGTADRATLWLRGDNRIVTAPAADIVEALIGVRLDPERLRALVAGCIAISADAERAERVGGVTAVTTKDALVYLVEDAAGARPRAGVFDRMLVDYRTMDAGRPREIGVSSEAGRTPAVTLTLTIRAIDINPSFTGREFAVVAPDSAVPASIDDLRAAGPLGGR